MIRQNGKRIDFERVVAPPVKRARRPLTPKRISDDTAYTCTLSALMEQRSKEMSLAKAGKVEPTFTIVAEVVHELAYNGEMTVKKLCQVLGLEESVVVNILNYLLDHKAVETSKKTRHLKYRLTPKLLLRKT